MNLYRVAVGGVASGLGGEHKLSVLVEGAGRKLLLCLTSAVGLECLHKAKGQAKRTPPLPLFGIMNLGSELSRSSVGAEQSTLNTQCFFSLGPF